MRYERFVPLVYLFVLLPLSMVLSGYALSKLWAWSLVPTLGVPALSVPAAIGVALTVSYLTHQEQETKDDEFAGERLVKEVIRLAFRPAFALGIGWVVAQWM